MLDCEQSLFFFRFQGGKGSARACERVSGVLLNGPREKRDCSYSVSTVYLFRSHILACRRLLCRPHRGSS